MLEDDKSIVIYGKSGSGKSGVSQYIVDYCKEKEIPYLAIKLDKTIMMKNTLDLWCKEELGLKKSLVYYIDEIAGNNKGVIILDQLDVLRWTNAHSEISINICNEIIKQVINVNKDRKSKEKPKISIVFCCRKYDLDNDKNIHSLIYENSELKFDKLKVGLLSDEEVQKIIGNGYLNFNIKFKKLLQYPSNLYIYMNLENRNNFKISTTEELIEKWWKDILDKSENTNLKLKEVKNLIIDNLKKMKDYIYIKI